MKTRILCVIVTSAVTLAAACSDDPNDGDILDFSTPPVGPVCTGVECLTDMDCGPVDGNGAGTSTTGGVCAFQFGSCQQCATDSDCERFAVTASTAFAGRTRCRNVGSAAAPRLECVCSTDAYCVRTGAGEVCVAGACAECGRDTDCLGQGPERCVGVGTASAFCAECAENADCPTGRSCLASRCVECDDDAGIECQGGLVCRNGACAECAADSDCMGNANGPVCQRGTCVAADCDVDADCPSGLVCADAGTADAQCVCDSNDDCPDGLVCVAGGTGDAQCVCDSNDDCDEDPAGGACLSPGTAGATCSCSTNADCAGRGGTCVEGECRCTSDLQCTVTGDQPIGQCRNL